MNKIKKAIIIGGVAAGIVGGVAMIPNEAPLEPVVIREMIAGKPAHEKAQIKSREMAKIDIKGVYTRKGIKVEIIGEIKDIDGGIEFFAKAWKNGKQLGFGKDGSVEIERFRSMNPPILVRDSNGDISRNFILDEKTGKTRIKKYREDPMEAILQDLAHTISLRGKENANITKGKTGHTITTFHPAAGANSPVDGRVEHNTGASNGITWNALVNSAGTGANVTQTATTIFQIFSDSGTDEWKIIRKNITLFDISAIGGDPVDGVDISFWGLDKNDGLSITPDINIYESAPANNDNLVGGDFDSLGIVEFSTTKTFAQWDGTDTQYNDFALNATGIAFVQTASDGDGIVKLGARNKNYDADEEQSSGNTDPTWSSVEESRMNTNLADIDGAGTTEDPKLTIDHQGATIFTPSIMSY